jgi:hypothetical protein
MAEQLATDGGKFSTLLTAIVESVPFQNRRGDDGAQKSARTVAIPPIPPPEKRKGVRRRFNNPEFNQRRNPGAETLRAPAPNQDR